MGFRDHNIPAFDLQLMLKYAFRISSFECPISSFSISNVQAADFNLSSTNATAVFDNSDCRGAFLTTRAFQGIWAFGARSRAPEARGTPRRPAPRATPARKNQFQKHYRRPLND